jgi:hypothetical protein
VATSALNLGHTLRDHGDPVQAETYLRRSAGIYSELGAAPPSG